jgi:hypothetical protein
MKHSTICLLTAVTCACFACNTRQQSVDTDITLVVDRTDNVILHPTADGIISQLGLQDSPWQGIRIKLTYVSDLDINPTTVIALEKENEWGGNLTVRRAKVQRFKNQLRECLQKMRRADTCQHSIIYRTIARQASNLATSPSTKKYLLVWSNLRENADNINFYDPQTFGLLKTSPQRIRQRLEATCPLSRLKGINVWLLYNPTSYRDNNSYMPLAGFYQHLLESHGAKVHLDSKFLVP